MITYSAYGNLYHKSENNTVKYFCNTKGRWVGWAKFFLAV